MFLNFANFYRRFVEFYAKITCSLTKFLKKSKNEKQNKSFLYKNAARAAFIELIEVFTQIFMLIHSFRFKKSNQVKNERFRICYCNHIVSVTDA